jgi:hypothetical protein
VSFESRALRLEREHGRPSEADIVVAMAADFLRGGEPAFARAFDRRGALLITVQRLQGEAWEAFKVRTRAEAGKTAGACSLLIGGLSEDGRNAVRMQTGDDQNADGMGPPYFQPGATELPRGAVTLPDIPPHSSQLEALKLIHNHRRAALVAGRRWGKTSLLTMLAVNGALAGRSVGVFCPTYKFLGPLFEPIVSALRALPGVRVNRMLGEVRLLSGGAIDFWSLDYTARAGRGRRYHLALIDESAHDEGRLVDSFPASIAPALLDFNGSVVTASTPNGLDGWFHDIVHDQRHGFAVFHAPTSTNPFLPVEAIAALREELPRPEVALQELDAQFVDTGGATIFPLATLLLENGEPHPDDFPCQAIGLAIDSNSGKGGEGRDGCAAVIFAVTVPGIWRGSIEGARCVLLDWDIQSLAQGGLAPWMQHMRELAVAWFRRLKPLGGPPSAYIEPAGNGYAVIEAARVQGLNPREIDSKYVAAGKDARALMAEPHATGGRLKIGRSALDKRTHYRGVMANHLVRQVTGFRAFDKDAYRREDDLLDAAMYSVLVCLGDGTEMRWSRLKRLT